MSLSSANSEQVVLEIDETPVIQGVAKANAALDSYGKKAAQSIDTAGKAFESHGGLVIRTSDRTRNSVERLIASSDKLTQSYGKTNVEKMVAQRDQLIQRLGKETAAVDRVRASWDKMIATEKAAEAQAQAAAVRAQETAARMASRASQLRAQAQETASNRSLGANIQNFAQDPLGALRSTAIGAAESMGPLGIVLAGTAVALGGVAVAGFEAARSLGAYAINIENAATRTGLSTREVTQFGFAAKLVGQDISTFEHGMRGLTAAMTDTSGAGAKAREKLHEIGVVPRELNGELKATGPLLIQISQALNRLPSAWERNAAGAEIFKKAWVEGGPAILALSKGVNLAASAGLTGSSEEQIKHYIANLERIEIAEAKWDRFFRSFKAGLVDTIEFVAKNGIPGVIGPILGPDAPGRPPRPADNSWAARHEALAAAQSRNEGNTLLNAARARMSNTPEGLKAAETEAKQKYEEAYKNIQTLSDVGAEAAQKEITKVAELGATYRRLSDQVKEIEKDESKRIANLVKVRDLMREGQTAYIIGTGALQTVVSGQQIFDANKPSRGIPSLFGRGQANPFQDVADAQNAFPAEMKQGLQVIGGQMVFVSPESARQTEGAGEASRAKGFGAGMDELEKQRTQIKLAGLNAETSATIRLLELRTNPGGEIETAHQVAGLRQSALDQELELTRDIVRYREASLQNELDLRQKLAELQHRQVDEIKSVAAGLFDTLFTKPTEFGKQLLSTIKSAFLKPITEGLGGIMANVLHPTIFGKDGNGGISGALHGIFQPGNRGIDSLQLTPQGYVPVVVMGAGESSSSSGGFSRLARRMGTGLAVGSLATAMAMGGGGGGVGTSERISFDGGVTSQDLGGGTTAGNPLGDLGAIAGIGGTGGFAGGYGGPGGGGAAGRSPLSGLLGNLKNLKNFKNINWGGLTRADAGGQADNGLPTTGKITGVNGVAGAALTAGGMMLAQQGLLGSSRGTWAGVGEGALGGAAVGFALGGPIGAAIGAGIGAGIGLGEKIAGVETPEREAARLIRSIYGLSIDSGSTTIKQIVGMAKQSFGGSVSVAVRSPQVRELLQLYADSTGQKSAALLAQQVHSASLAERGGSLYQSAVYNNGTPYTYASSLPTLGPSGGTLPTGNPMGGQVVVNVSPEATQNLWATGTALAIAGNPRGVAAASVNGSGQSAARLNAASLQLSPSTITS